MIQMGIILRDPLVMAMVTGDPSSGKITIANQLCQARKLNDDDIIFYDWLLDNNGSVCGVEIHINPDSNLIRSSSHLKNLHSVDIGIFPRIWFGQVRNGKPQGCEAFGDLYLFDTDNGDLAIVIDLSAWLSIPQAQQLIATYCVG